MALGFFILILSLLALVGGFLVARVLAAPSGSRRLKVALGFERDAWEGTSFGRRAGFALAGLVGFYFVTALISTVGYLASGTEVSDDTSMRVFVASDGPAARAGVRDGDRIVSLDGTAVTDWDSLRTLVSEHRNEPISLALDRQGMPVTVSVTAGPDGKLLVGPPVTRRAVGLGEAVASGFGEPPKIWAVTVKGFARILTGREKSELTGPVGIAVVTNKAAQTGLGHSLRLVGAVAAYFFWAPVLVSLVAFPRGRRFKRS